MYHLILRFGALSLHKPHITLYYVPYIILIVYLPTHVSRDAGVPTNRRLLGVCGLHSWPESSQRLGPARTHQRSGFREQSI